MRRALVCAAALVVLAGCAGSNSNGSSPASTASRASQAPSVKPKIPAASSPSPDPNFDQGQAIFITDKGFVPAWLVAKVDETITWVNQTDHPVAIHFDNLGSDAPAPEIAPGKAWAWRPTSWASVLYHDSADPKVQGKIQVEPK